MQAWAKHTGKHTKKPRGLSKIKSSFRQQLKNCVEKKLIRQVCSVIDDTDHPFIIYAFLDNVTGNEVYAYTA